MIEQFVRAIERLNIANYTTVVGQYFPEIVSIIAIVFGGVLLLFSWQLNRYFFIILGGIGGILLGLICKNSLPYVDKIDPAVYMVIFLTGGVALSYISYRFVGILLGGVVVLVIVVAFFPSLLSPEKSDFPKLAMIFLLGGGLGVIFTKITFIFVSALLGSAFITYGASVLLLDKLLSLAQFESYRTVATLLLFLPCLLFGIIYQLLTAKQPEPSEKVEHSSKTSCM